MMAFVVMPFKDDIANAIYEHSTKMICKEKNLEVKRADEIFSTNPILDDILNAIKDASVIIADISGKNPNVFYELGISHILKQTQTIMVTHDEYDKLPFDISHFRIIKYENTIFGKVEYEKQLRLMLDNILMDYRTLFKREFDLIINILQQTGTDYSFFALMGLVESKVPIKINQGYECMGTNTKYEMKIGGAAGDKIESLMSNFILFNYVEINNDFILITEKGKTLVQYLKEQGYVLEQCIIGETEIYKKAEQKQAL
jgi:hypothetical protein